MATTSTVSSTPISDLTAEDWHKSAPKPVRQAFTDGDLAAGWVAWQDHLASRKRPIPMAELLGDANALQWAAGDASQSSTCNRLLQLAGRTRTKPNASLENTLKEWLATRRDDAGNVLGACEAVAWSHALPDLAGALSDKSWLTLLDHLLAMVSDAAGIAIDDEPLLHQLVAGELPLTLAYLFPEMTRCRKLKSSARKALSVGPVELLDGEGLPHGKHLTRLRSLLACWTRCGIIGDELKGGCFNSAARDQYEWLVRHALRFARPNGTPTFSAPGPPSSDKELFRAAVRLGGDHDDYGIAAMTLPGGKRFGDKPSDPGVLPDAATHSEWASVAMLRTNWSRSSPRLAVAYHDAAMQAELNCGKDTLWSGTWDLDVRFQGKRAKPNSAWDEVCWLSDDDVDYLELEIELTGGVRVQRQMVLARADRFLLLADAIMAGEPGTIEYRASLPLCPGVAFQAAKESNEGFLFGSKRRALVLPLALPEWRGEQGTGKLEQSDGRLELSLSAEGTGLYAPLFFDLDTRRMTRRMTWRHLTVAESLEAVPAEVAVGFRVAIAKQQWLIYRSIAEKENRTLLGHNLSSEMLVAQFERTGEVEPLVEIE